MKEKELKRKEALLERELVLLSEKTVKSENEFCGRLNDLEFRMKALELYVAAVLPNTSGTTHDIQSKIFDMKPVG